MKKIALSGLEENIMDIVWELQKCPIREVKSKLDETNKLAYTTVATIICRLENKGFLKRIKQNGGICYCPKITKEEYSRGITASFFNKIYESFGNIALVSFAESLGSLSKDKKDYFLKLLEKNENK